MTRETDIAWAIVSTLQERGMRGLPKHELYFESLKRVAFKFGYSEFIAMLGELVKLGEVLVVRGIYKRWW